MALDFCQLSVSKCCLSWWLNFSLSSRSPTTANFRIWIWSVRAHCGPMNTRSDKHCLAEECQTPIPHVKQRVVLRSRFLDGDHTYQNLRHFFWPVRRARFLARFDKVNDWQSRFERHSIYVKSVCNPTFLRAGRRLQVRFAAAGAVDVAPLPPLLAVSNHIWLPYCSGLRHYNNSENGSRIIVSSAAMSFHLIQAKSTENWSLITANIMLMMTFLHTWKLLSHGTKYNLMSIGWMNNLMNNVRIITCHTIWCRVRVSRVADQILRCRTILDRVLVW